ncbi:hypothetical protein SAMN05660690_1427 [Geodermatophilus telluris]|uniref:Uncharacterized protein n=1 Tax=Geodermatophilus telluris TaxID=1190417 RepID=A0A1G6LJW8_9ACTN|nr:hypothetical protein [Geodermatophilus telluris]SDC43503.1 hypothetical protein SAMN05660690_1427 [Geodermatophilus telluris]
MAGNRRHRRPSLGTRLAVTAAAGAVVVLGTPGVGSAAGGPMKPLVTCVLPVQDGSWTAVFGYENPTPLTWDESRGFDNELTPAALDGPQVTSFAPGTHHGAFSVRVPASTPSVEWQVHSRSVTASRDGSTRCPSETELPADGNGLGAPMVLAAAGLVGAASLAVSRRRRPGPPGAGAPPA